LDVRKAEKREVIEVKGFVVSGLDAKAALSDVQQSFNKHASESQQRAFELRQELFKKVSEIQSLVSAGVGTKVSLEEFNEALSQKTDVTTFRTLMEQKANYSDMESQQRFLERLIRELESKASAKEFDQHVMQARTTVDELHKEVLLRATIKDVCTLLDQKANVEDINATLALVQREVEKRAAENDLKKALNEQALVNEALCAQNCVGRWIWKSGELKSP
jgi:hypothetical protein